MRHEDTPPYWTWFFGNNLLKGLLIELEKTVLALKSEVGKDIHYECQLVGKRRLDVSIDDKVLIELKAISELDRNCYNQIINYLNIFGLEVGLLLNFGADSLQFKRFVNTTKNP